MDYVYQVLSLLGGLGVFLIGMHALSDSMSKLANGKMQKLLNKTSKSKVTGVGIGCVVTMIAQSSSLTTVMVVGLVNAGIITLFQATTMIMGANVGTTITAQIVALQSFDVAKFAVVLALIGIFMVMFTKKEGVNSTGKALYGLGLIFIGLELMSASMQFFRTEPAVLKLFQSINNPFLLLLLGIVFTAIVQSSSAVTSILITMTSAGIMIGSGGNSILYVILGTNIGTCVTALLSSIGASTNGKRASLIHLLFNTFGTIMFMILLLSWKDFMNVTFTRWFKGAPGTQIAMFHTFFNVIGVFIMLPFTKYFVKLANLIIKDKKVKQVKLVNLDERLLISPDLALMQFNKEVSTMFDKSMGLLKESFGYFKTKDISSISKIDVEIKNMIIINKELTDFLVKLSAQDVNIKEESKFSALHYSLNDILRITEIAENFGKYTKHYVEDNLEFSETVLQELTEMFDEIEKLYQLTQDIFLNDNKSLLPEVDAVEDKIDGYRRNLINGHIQRLNEGKCKPECSGVFINLVSNLERAADHITFIAHSLDNI